MIVVDSSVILATLLDEPGGDVLLSLHEPFSLSVYNFAEVVSKLTEKGYGQSEVAALVSPFRAKSHPLSSGQAMRAGLWRNATRRLGLSLGDRCCLALATDLKATVLTADRAWEGLDLGVPIRVIR